MENKKIFAMPLAGDGLNYVKKLVEKYNDITYEVFGSNGITNSAIDCKRINNDEFEDIVSYLHDNDIKFNYTMNSMQTESYFKNDMYKIIIDFLCDIKVDSITVTEPYFGVYAKENTNLKIIASSLIQVKSEVQINNLLKYKFDRIILSEDCLKTIPLLKYLRRVTPEDVKLEFLIYNWCKRGCVDRRLHYNIHNNDILTKMEIGDIGCTKTLKEFLMASWIRPKDIPRYQEIGIDLFKFSGRHMNTENMLNSINSYLNMKSVPIFYNLYPDDFDDFFDFLFEKGCNERCLDCNMCEYFAKKIYFEEE
jgi:collagenase-like PrtC family protease